mmetsp:Transcript_119445/g.273651  ORF Transcript_119445/g.273651 Transcript_119445/m.273651 type:complete len:227 (+) Transcript_119445:366-1046(+)
MDFLNISGARQPLMQHKAHPIRHRHLRPRKTHRVPVLPRKPHRPFRDQRQPPIELALHKDSPALRHVPRRAGALVPPQPGGGRGGDSGWDVASDGRRGVVPHALCGGVGPGGLSPDIGEHVPAAVAVPGHGNPRQRGLPVRCALTGALVPLGLHHCLRRGRRRRRRRRGRRGRRNLISPAVVNRRSPGQAATIAVALLRVVLVRHCPRFWGLGYFWHLVWLAPADG